MTQADGTQVPQEAAQEARGGADGARTSTGSPDTERPAERRTAAPAAWMSDYRRLPDGTWTETHWTFAPNSKPVRSAAPEENP